MALGDGKRLHPKALVDLAAKDVVHLSLPGGGGYGDPFQRDAQRVLWDVIEGYVSPEKAEKSYGVAVRYVGKVDELVKLPGGWVIDVGKTASLRKTSG
jgi:N-methylhydantoinase B